MAALTARERDLRDRGGALKMRLVDFATSPPLQRQLRAAARAQAEADPSADPEDLFVDAVEHLLFDFRYADGSGVLDRFLATSSLDDTDRDLAEGFRGGVVGIFEVHETGVALLLHSVVNDLDHVVAPTIPEAVAGLAPGCFISGRILPVGAFWILSGRHAVFPADHRAAVADAVVGLLVEAPHLSFDNPELLEAARRQTAAQHRTFLEHFGTDLVVLPADEVGAAYADMLTAHAGGRGDASATRQIALDAVAGAHFDADAHVGLLSHPVAGTSFLVDADQVLAALSQAGASSRSGGVTIIDYLDDETVPPWAFERLVSEVPAGSADRALAAALGRPGFVWALDGGALLVERKPSYVGHPLRPPLAVMPSLVQEVRGSTS